VLIGAGAGAAMSRLASATSGLGLVKMIGVGAITGAVAGVAASSIVAAIWPLERPGTHARILAPAAALAPRVPE
jgi:hypothetical protein